jgi:Rne/Rng family ribonuclease
MSKELVISASSHERRVAILEEGQLVEIYIEREKEFALVGSIYKGRVTRVLPGMQSAFVDIGLDGDAFLYVSDVFENLEDYDHGHGHGEPQQAPVAPRAASTVELLPGETIAQAAAPHEEFVHEEHAPEEAPREEHASSETHESPGNFSVEQEQGETSAQEAHAEPEERQPESNASAPQNFSPHYNPTKNYPPRTGNDRGGRDFGRGDRGNDRGGDRGGQFNRRGGRRRGGRPQGGPGGRNLPSSKYASPQGGDRGPGPRGYEPRRPENPRPAIAPVVNEAADEPILLPGESLAKYRGKPVAAPAPAPVERPAPREIEQEGHEPQPQLPEPAAPRANPVAGTPRRFSGSLPHWVLAEGASEAPIAAESAAAEESAEVANIPPTPPLSDAEAVALSASLVEAKHEETQAKAEADAVSPGADLLEDPEELAEETSEELGASPESELSAEDTADAEERASVRYAEAEADAAHDEAEHASAAGTLELHSEENGAAEEHHVEEHEDEQHGEHAEQGETVESELQQGFSNEADVSRAAVEDDVILLPGETRAPRSSTPGAPREEFPRQSARVDSNPRSRFQRPQRGGFGRDRGGRGGRPDGRGGRPDRGGRDRGGRPGQRFDRRPSGPGGSSAPQRQDRGYRGHSGGHSGPSRRPQLISEMLKAGQDVVIQIAKEPLGKKGARITSHVALPGRFLVYMPTVHHTGVSRKIVSAENRSRLRRLVSEAGNNYPGGFIVRTAAGEATDEEIRADIEFLGKTWNEIKERSEQRKAPALLHRDLDLVERMLRDYMSDDFSAIWIDNEEEYGKVVEFVSRFQPKLVNRVKLYTKEQPIFEEFGIQHELDKALRAKVWLKSGGYIVINHTEALVAIDVNTGKFVGKGSIRLEDTIVKTNIEAVKEIVRQIRLRDLGGIIVVDFIDMEERRNREKVLAALQQALDEDKAPSKALSFNEFGLVCITRKRTKQALERVLCQSCPSCSGSGMVKSIPTLCYEIQAEARKMAMAGHEGPNLTLRVHPEIAKALKTRESMLIDELEQTAHKHIIIQSDATLHWEQYDIY